MKDTMLLVFMKEEKKNNNLQQMEKNPFLVTTLVHPSVA